MAGAMPSIRGITRCAWQAIGAHKRRPRRPHLRRVQSVGMGVTSCRAHRRAQCARSCLNGCLKSQQRFRLLDAADLHPGACQGSEGALRTWTGPGRSLRRCFQHSVSPLCADLLRAGLRATRCPELDVERTDASEKKPDLAMHHAPTLPNYGRVAEFLAPCSNVLSKNGLIVRDAPESHVSVSCAANMAAYGDDSSRSACQCHSAVYTFHQDARSCAADPPSLSSHP